MNIAPFQSTDITVAVAVNDRAILANCLERSPDIAGQVVALTLHENFATAGAAYNDALEKLERSIVVFAHQDVYLPLGFGERLARTLSDLSRADPDWAVAGVMGVTAAREHIGLTWSTGIGKVLGLGGFKPTPVESLDEMLLITRSNSGLRFDTDLPSFHLYGTDIVQTAKKANRKSYVIEAPVIHHSRPVVTLSGGYLSAYRYMQQKWQDNLPIPTLVCPLTRSIAPLAWRNWKLRYRGGGGRQPAPCSNPADIARRIGFELAAP